MLETALFTVDVTSYVSVDDDGVVVVLVEVVMDLLYVATRICCFFITNRYQK